ncbi:MAG: protein arginine kinase [Thermosediminibacterales bacterium]|nr:protein arginine kinase [Thermosediminibacterales bacterium]MDK2836387.1 protein arginine kinase [Thermosediminibacterales bacterium]
MSLDDFIYNSKSLWMEGNGPEADVVLSSRIRLARNLRNVPFPHKANLEQADKIIKQVFDAIEKSSEFAGQFRCFRMKELTHLERQILVEKHLISPALAESEKGAAFIKHDESVSIMVNEEDHIRIQTLYPGLQMEKAWQLSTKIDDVLEERLDYAFDEKKGYLTACPTNVGTGIRVSVMLHLPALNMLNQSNGIFTTIGQVGLTVRGLYGEGSKGLGNIYQISNQLTLGQSEEDIINNLKGVTKQIIEHERSAREKLLKDAGIRLQDRVGRAYGILSNSYIISSQEAMELLSDVRLGIDLNLIKNLDSRILNEMMILIRPAYLQKFFGQELNEYERDIKRASLLRDRLKQSEIK